MGKAAEREGKLKPMSFRATPELRAKLEAAASKAGRSLTSEVEHRLEASFLWPKFMDDMEKHTNEMVELHERLRVVDRAATAKQKAKEAEMAEKLAAAEQRAMAAEQRAAATEQQVAVRVLPRGGFIDPELEQSVFWAVSKALAEHAKKMAGAEVVEHPAANHPAAKRPSGREAAERRLTCRG